MKTTGWIHIIIACMCALSGCRQSGGNDGEVNDFSVSEYSPEYASGFEIFGAEGKKSVIITVSNPWQGSDSVTTRLFISRDGEKAPAGFDGSVLEGDAKRIVAMSSTNIAMLDAIGKVSHLVGISGMDYVSNPYVRSHRDSIVDVGYDGNINYEMILAADPDIVLLYGVNGASSMEHKLKELNIPYMYVGDYLEESPLGKAEWMVALAEITGDRATGVQQFSELPIRYNELIKRVSEAKERAPKVMFNTPYGDSWFMPSNSSYAVRLIEDAGAEYVYHKNSGNSSVPIDLEEAYMLASEADFWIHTGMANSIEELKSMCPKFGDVGCVAKGNIYNNTLRSTPQGGNDYFESAVVHPDLVLRDLIKVFHPGLVDEEFVYYKKLL